MEQRKRVSNSNIQDIYSQMGGRSRNSPERETHKKRSISAQRDRSHSKERNVIHIDDENDFNMSNHLHSQYSNHSRKGSRELVDYSKLESFTRKKAPDETQGPIYNPKHGKLPSVEEKRKRVTALQDFMNVNYGSKPDGEDKIPPPKDFEDKRLAGRDIGGGNIRKKMYRLKGEGNSTFLSDNLNVSMDGKVSDYNSSVPERKDTEFTESEMNPEEIHYFFVANIQKARKLNL